MKELILWISFHFLVQGGESEGEKIAKINRTSAEKIAKVAFMSACIWTVGIVVGIIIFGFALNFGISGFVNILQGIQNGINKIPSTFDVVDKKVASFCRWEGDIFSQRIFGRRNCTEPYEDLLSELLNGSSLFH